MPFVGNVQSLCHFLCSCSPVLQIVPHSVWVHWGYRWPTLLSTVNSSWNNDWVLGWFKIATVHNFSEEMQHWGMSPRTKPWNCTKQKTSLRRIHPAAFIIWLTIAVGLESLYISVKMSVFCDVRKMKTNYLRHFSTCNQSHKLLHIF